MNPHGSHAARPPRTLISTRTLHNPNDALFTPSVTPVIQKHPTPTGNLSLLTAYTLLLIDSRALDSPTPVIPVTPATSMTPVVPRTPESSPALPITRWARENQYIRDASETRKLE